MAGVDVQASLRGGLGNQLFQYAAALHTLKAIGGSSFELLMLEGHYSPNISDFLDVGFRPATRADRAKWTQLAVAPGPLRPALRVSAGIAERVSPRITFEERYPYEPPPPFVSGQQLRLHGFFWHPDWFVDVWQDVAAALLDRAPAGFDDLRAAQRTVVSLRQRDDYRQAGWTLPMGYYEAVIAELRQRSDEREIVVISDEPTFVPWFEAFLTAEGFAMATREPLSGDGPVDDFWNIAAAANLAIPNSTFSWWAAAVAVNRATPARVLYPEPWVPNRWNSILQPAIGLPQWTELPSGFPLFEKGYGDE